MDAYKEAMILHEENKGKLTITSKVPIENAADLSVAYTPGVAAPCLEIAKEPAGAYRYTCKGNRWRWSQMALPFWAWGISVPRRPCR